MNLKGKTALVTGGSQGIGKAIALGLSKKGVVVGIHYLGNDKEAQDVLDGVIKNGSSGFIFKADFEDPKNAINLAKESWDKLGQINFLINNAGISYKRHFLDATIEDVDHFTNVNFKSTLFLTQGIARKMVESNIAGSIYTITSVNGIQPGVGLNIYGATKGALETLMKGVALELAPHNIKVNTIAPGAIESSMNPGNTVQEVERLKMVSENIPMGRLGQPEEIASLICCLLESDSYMTGATIAVDGGWMLKQGYANPVPYKTQS